METKKQLSGQKIIATIKEKINREKHNTSKVRRAYDAHDDWKWNNH